MHTLLHEHSKLIRAGTVEIVGYSTLKIHSLEEVANASYRMKRDVVEFAINLNMINVRCVKYNHESLFAHIRRSRHLCLCIKSSVSFIKSRPSSQWQQ